MKPARFILPALLVLASPAFAQESPSPAIHRVVNVAAGDKLNIRAEPRADAEIVGAYRPNAAPVEVLETREVGGRQWGRVIIGEQDGWVSMAFLRPHTVPMIRGTELPIGLACFGTEPFWGLKLNNDNEAVFDRDGEPQVNYSLRARTPFAGLPRSWALFGRTGEHRAAISVRAQSCTDGMSDRTYGWEIHFLAEGADRARAFHGCCQLSTPEGLVERR